MESRRVLRSMLPDGQSCGFIERDGKRRRPDLNRDSPALPSTPERVLVLCRIDFSISHTSEVAKFLADAFGPREVAVFAVK